MKYINNISDFVTPIDQIGADSCDCGTIARGVFGGGSDSAGDPRNVLDYITFASTGNATDFGDLTANKVDIAACSNGADDRGVFGGGYLSPNYLNVIEYIAKGTAGNASDFGDLTVGRDSLAACSNGADNRGVFGGGCSSGGIENTMDYITISSPGNASDFGDLTVGRDSLAAC